MEKKNFTPIILLLITMIIAYSVMPIISRFFTEYLSTYVYLFVIVLTLSIAFLSKGSTSITKYLGILIPFIIWQIFSISISERALSTAIYRGFLELVPIVIGAYSVDRLGYKGLRVLSLIILLIFIVTAITTITGLQLYPDASRYLATVSNVNAEENIRYNYLNIGGYDFVYTLTLLYPLLIFGYKKKKIHWIFLLLGAIIVLTVIINCGYTIALLLFIVSTLFVFLPKKLKIWHTIVIIIIAIIFLYLFSPLISDGLNYIADIIKNKNISVRLRMLAEGREGMESGGDDRISIYMMSVNTFLQHPILGRALMDETLLIGGHSFILDFIANFGIIGITLLIVMYRVIYVKFFKPYKEKEGFGYVFWFFVQPIILSFFNTGMWFGVLCLYIPVVLAYINKKGVRNENLMDSKFRS